jgi:type I restriction enzyme S subunit
MSSEWTEQELGDLLVAVIDHRGRTPKKLGGDFTAHGIPVISAKNIKNSRLVLGDAVRYIPPAMWDRWMPVKLSAGDVLLTSEAPLGETAYLADSDDLCLGQRLFALRADSRRLHSHYLFYALQGPTLRSRILARASGTTAQGIRQAELVRVPVPVPPVDEQQRIARVLSSLDDKIENTRRLAKTLDQIAIALFKARFVDFVGHDRFIKSEIGPIPRGWSVSDIYEVASVTYGRPFKSSLFDDSDGVPLLRIRDLATQEPRVCTTEHRDDGRLIKAGDIVVGMDGEFRAHIWSGPDTWLNQRVCAFDPLPGISPVFVLGAIRPPLAFFEATKSGTTVIHLGKRDIDTFRVVHPPDAVMGEFRAEADPLLLNAVAARKESRTLAAIRDALLPRLISGQIRVPPDPELAWEAA